MKAWTLWISGCFTSAIALLAVAAGWRAAPLRVPDTAGWWDGSATRAFEARYDAVFPLRTLGLNLWTAIGYVLLDEGRRGVVVGRRGWLYSAEEFDARAGAQAQVVANLAEVTEARRQLAARGSALLVALLPAKARLYPQHLGARRPAALHAALYGQALAAVRRQGIAAPDLHRTLAACSVLGEVFLRTDTHWTPDGARCVAGRLAVVARSAGWRARTATAYRTTIAPEAAHRGDLLAFLPLEPWFARLLPEPDRIAVPRTEPVAAGALFDEPPRPEVVLVGTSFSVGAKWNFTGALQQAFGEDILNHAASARGPFAPMREYLGGADFRAAPPRLVIWEIPERYLPLPDAAAQPSPEPEANP